MSPKISIVTVCYNSESTIRNTLESVLEQDYSNIEHIIVDGASTDGTMRVISEYDSQIAKIISEPDEGIYDAMNKGIKISSGDVIGILNSDDYYSTCSSLRHLMHQMLAANADTVFADLVLVDPNDTSRVIRFYDSSRFRPDRLRFGWMPAHPTFLVKREFYEKWGGYSLNYRIAADYEMIARLYYKAKATYVYLPEVVVKMRAGGLSTKGIGNSWLLNKEIVRACHENGIKTNLPKVLMKIPMKIREYFRKEGV